MICTTLQKMGSDTVSDFFPDSILQRLPHNGAKAYTLISLYNGGWNKSGGGAKVAKSLKAQVGINVEGGIFWKKLVHNSNKRGVEGGKI